MRHEPAIAIAAVAVFIASPHSAAADNAARPSPTLTGSTIADFNADDAADNWITVNDNVMGGRSTGGPVFRPGVMTFTGSTNTDGGGFSSIRMKPRDFDIASAEGFELIVRGDGRDYYLDLRTGAARPGAIAVAYWAPFSTEPLLEPVAREDDSAATPGDEWQTIRIPFSAIYPTLFGEPIADRAPMFNPEDFTAFGLIIYDKKDGAFRLDVDSISVYNAATPIMTFDNADALNAWNTVNDGVMGGRSSGTPTLEDDRLIFSGVINTNGGGFSSIRTNANAGIESWGLADAEGIALRVRGDDRAYNVSLRTNAAVRGGRVSYQASFEIPSSPEAGPDMSGGWHEVRVPFSEMRASWRGRDISAMTEQLNPANAVLLGLGISDGVDGPFKIEVDWIGVY